jgi:hypothetical protein
MQMKAQNDGLDLIKVVVLSNSLILKKINKKLELFGDSEDITKKLQDIKQMDSKNRGDTRVVEQKLSI